MPEFGALHPYIPQEQARGYQEMLEELERDLCEITGYDKFSFQPNRSVDSSLRARFLVAIATGYYGAQEDQMVFI